MDSTRENDSPAPRKGQHGGPENTAEQESPDTGPKQESRQETDASPKDTPGIRYHVQPDLDYVYRDVFNVYASSSDVVIEMGNLHRALPGHVTIANRIVVSLSNAHVLLRTLREALDKAQLQMQQELLARQRTKR